MDNIDRIVEHEQNVFMYFIDKLQQNHKEFFNTNERIENLYDMIYFQFRFYKNSDNTIEMLTQAFIKPEILKTFPIEIQNDPIFKDSPFTISLRTTVPNK
jgi:hypothetical protein